MLLTLQFQVVNALSSWWDADRHGTGTVAKSFISFSADSGKRETEGDRDRETEPGWLAWALETSLLQQIHTF